MRYTIPQMISARISNRPITVPITRPGFELSASTKASSVVKMRFPLCGRSRFRRLRAPDSLAAVAHRARGKFRELARGRVGDSRYEKRAGERVPRPARILSSAHSMQLTQTLTDIKMHS